MGQPEVFATVPLGLDRRGSDRKPAAGVARRGRAGHGVRGGGGGARDGGETRRRTCAPSQTTDPYEFRPFTHSDAFPSGHATMAFALATALGDEIGHPWWARVGLFAAATATAWSRLNDNMHWLSDVLGGAALGVTSAQVMEGRWTAFHLHPPTFSSSWTTGVRWTVTLPLP